MTKEEQQLIDDLIMLIHVICKKRCIEFKEWEDSSLEGKEWHKYDGHDTWINTYTMQVISTEQLYELFLKDKK